MNQMSAQAIEPLESISSPASRPADMAPLYLILAAGVTIGSILQWKGMDYCPNDASRWNTIYYLVQHHTFEYLPNHGAWWSPEEWKTPWEIGPFWTIDMIRIQGEDGSDHYYSSKPPLFSTLIAGVVWLIQLVTLEHARFQQHPWFIIRATLIVAQVVPLLLLIWVYRHHLYRASEQNFVRHYCLAAAAAGTYLTAWSVTLNNHTAAAFTCMMAIHAGIRIWYDGRRENWRFAMAGLFAAMTASLELPAGLFAVGLFLALLFKDWRRTLMFGASAAGVVAGGAVLLNYISIGRLRPAYMEFGRPGGAYDYPGSYWNQITGIDALVEPKYVYLFNMLVGHHGFFLLTPILLLALVGLIAQVRNPLGERRLLAAAVLLLTAALAAVYCKTTNNYGGTAEGFRWLFWVTPLWLLFLPSGVTLVHHSRVGRTICYLFLGVSFMSMAFALRMPWGESWAHLLFRRLNWIDY